MILAPLAGYDQNPLLNSTFNNYGGEEKDPL